MLKRSRARRQALQLLYEREINGSCLESTGGKRTIVEEKTIDGEPTLCDEPVESYAYALVTGVIKQGDVLDAMIEDVSTNWSLARMPVVDRSILRLSCYEMCNENDVPIGVTINEAVELARAFGGEDDSYRFVNGVLGKIARSLGEPEAADGEAPEEEPGTADGVAPEEKPGTADGVAPTDEPGTASAVLATDGQDAAVEIPPADEPDTEKAEEDDER